MTGCRMLAFEFLERKFPLFGPGSGSPSGPGIHQDHQPRGHAQRRRQEPQSGHMAAEAAQRRRRSGRRRRRGCRRLMSGDAPARGAGQHRRRHRPERASVLRNPARASDSRHHQQTVEWRQSSPTRPHTPTRAERPCQRRSPRGLNSCRPSPSRTPTPGSAPPSDSTSLSRGVLRPDDLRHPEADAVEADDEVK